MTRPRIPHPWLPRECLPRRGSPVWRIRDALGSAVGVFVVLNVVVFSWVKLPQWASVLISVISALVVGLLVLIATSGKLRH
jgi:membrane protein YdbS with pleckstrin-like domain